MGYMRTALLLAAMTGLFLAAGFLIGGQQGMVIAFVIACAMNLFAYWNADKLVLRMYRAEPVDETTAPEFHRLVSDLAARAGLPKPKIYHDRECRSRTPSPPAAIRRTPRSPRPPAC